MAAANYFEIVQNLYIAYYQRPADPAGLKYWPDQIEAKGGVASSIVNAFATSPESIALYGPINATNIGDVVDKIYLALFNRVPDAAGKQFYVDGFTAGTFTAGTIALDVLNGATNGDNTAIQNKVQVANAFTAQIDGRDLTDPAFGTGTSFSATYSGDADAQAARNILKAVTSDPTTVLSPVQVTEQIKTKIADTGDKILTSTGLTFKVTENPTTHAVSFDGTATGDITIAWAGAVGRTVATFTRAGLTGTASFPKATSIALGATDVLSTSAANIAALPISGATGTVKLTDTSLAAASLNTLNAAIAGALNASTVTTTTGSAADLATLVAAKTAGTIALAANFAATVTGTVSVAGANAIDAANGTGVITATIIEGTVAALKMLTGADNAYTLTVSDTTAAAADLIALDALTTVAVGAGKVTTITGSVADIKTVAAAAGITKAANWSAVPTDVSVSVADANTLDAANGTGVITATITAGAATTLKTLTGTNNAYTLTVTDTTAAAADLLALDALTTVAVGAGAVTTITGSVAHIKTVAAAAGITKAANWSAAPTDVSVSVADANILNAANGDGVITATITAGTVATLKTLTGADNAYKLTITDATAASADLIALDERTTVAVDAGAVTTITGSVAHIKTVAAAAGITKAANWSTAPMDVSISVADANTLDAANGTGVITETITEGDVATLKTLTGTNNAYTLTVTDTTAAAADLLALDALTTGVVGAGKVATITGSVAEIKAVAAAAGITKAAKWSAAPTDASVSIADANILDAANGTGVITATITEGDVTTLKTLTGTNNAYTLTVTDTTAAAADLIALDARTTVAVDADAVTTITGSVANIKTVAAAAGITKAANWSAAPTDTLVSVADANILNAANGDGVITATITAGTVATLMALTGTGNAYTLTVTNTTAAAADLLALDALTTGVVRADPVTTITGSAADLAALDAAKIAGTIALAGWAGLAALSGSALVDTLVGGTGADTFKYMATSEFGDTIMDFGNGADVLHLSGAATFNGFFVQSGVTSGSDYFTKNVFIFSGNSGAEVNLNTVATQIANDTSVNATAGLIILKSDTSHEVEVWYCADMDHDGAKQLIATLVGVDIATANFILA